MRENVTPGKCRTSNWRKSVFRKKGPTFFMTKKAFHSPSGNAFLTRQYTVKNVSDDVMVMILCFMMKQSATKNIYERISIHRKKCLAGEKCLNGEHTLVSIRNSTRKRINRTIYLNMRRKFSGNYMLEKFLVSIVSTCINFFSTHSCFDEGERHPQTIQDQ